MYGYPEGLLVISRAHRDELMAEAQRWSLIREARAARRAHRARLTRRGGSVDRTAHGNRRGDPDIGHHTGTLAACGPRVAEPVR
jgi:hypothetical protein